MFVFYVDICVLAVSQEGRVGCQVDESLVSLRIVVTVIEINRQRGREVEEAGGCFVTEVAPLCQQNFPGSD